MTNENLYNDAKFVQALDSIKDDNDQVIKIKKHLVDEETLESLGEEYDQTKEGIRQTIVNYVPKILHNLHDIRKNILEKIKEQGIIYFDEMNFKDLGLALFFAELLCYKNSDISLDRQIGYLYILKNHSLSNILALIKSNILKNDLDIFGEDELSVFLINSFPNISNIEKLKSNLQSKGYLNKIDNKYYFPYIYKTKKEMINFIFSITANYFKIPKGNEELKEILDIYFPNIFEEEDVKRLITTAIENSRNIVLWGNGAQIHKKHIRSILNEFNFDSLLGHINSILYDNRIDLETTYNKYEQSLKKANIPNKYALHTLLKIKYPDRFNYPKAPWIAKIETEDVNLVETLLNIMNEDRVYHIDELTETLHQTKIRVLQLIERINDIETVDTNHFRNVKVLKICSELNLEDADEIKNIMVLFNPYYNKNVIKDHVEILEKEGKVAFGKVLSKYREKVHPNQDRLDKIYDSASSHTPLQLFLTDYDSIYVANVIDVEYETDIPRPAYYDELEVESWFILDDIRVIVEKNFTEIRDRILSNFKTVGEHSATYTLYGNSYVYPLEVVMKEPINYFDKEDENHKFYLDIFKSENQLRMKQNLISFNFGKKRFYSFATSTQDNLINAELEYDENRLKKQYDFSSVVIKYAKAVEQEIWLFLKDIFSVVIKENQKIANFQYSLNGRDYPLENILENKANFGTYLYLLKQQQIIDAINEYVSPKGGLLKFIFSSIPYYIKLIQEVRNESAHGTIVIDLNMCDEIREVVVGIGKSSVLTEFVRMKKYIYS